MCTEEFRYKKYMLEIKYYLQVSLGLACRAKAIIPAANGAAADVPVWLTVQPPPTSKQFDSWDNFEELP